MRSFRYWNNTPFGWIKKKQRLVVNEPEQWIIKRVLEQMESGKSLDEISTELTKIEIKPRNGGEWFPRRIKKILTENEATSKSLNLEIWPSQTVATKETTTPKEIVIPPSTPTNIFQIKETLEDSRHESTAEIENRSKEVSKVIMQILMLGEPRRHNEKQLREGVTDELQDWDIRKS